MCSSEQLAVASFTTVTIVPKRAGDRRPHCATLAHELAHVLLAHLGERPGRDIRIVMGCPDTSANWRPKAWRHRDGGVRP
jgi:hypothetical protein